MIEALRSVARRYVKNVLVEWSDGLPVGTWGEAGFTGTTPTIKLAPSLAEDADRAAWICLHEVAHIKLGHVAPGEGITHSELRAAPSDWLIAIARRRYEANEQEAEAWAAERHPAATITIKLYEMTNQVKGILQCLPNTQPSR